jgi:DNA polymerase-3 subunit alpha
VRGRVDHKEAGKTCLIAQTVEVFAPSEQEIEDARKQSDAAAATAVSLARPVHVQIDPAALSPNAIEDLRQIVADYAGPAEIVLQVGARALRLGDAYRVQNTPTLRAELENALAPLSAVA